MKTEWGIHWCCCSWGQHSQDLVLTKALTSSLLFLLYFPEYLTAPKIFRIQWVFFNSFSVLSCLHHVLVIFFLSSPPYFLWRQELSCQSQFGSLTEDLERGWFVPGRSRAHCIYYWFVPRHDLALHFCIFFSPFTVTFSCPSSLETHKNQFNPRPTSSLCVLGLMAPFPFLCLQFALFL